MSEFRNLPLNQAPSADDGLLLVTASSATRITVKSLFWDQVAVLKFLWPGNSSYGIGTADQWAKIPYNTLELDSSDDWIQLNADGSFTLLSGRYLIRSCQTFNECDLFRFALYQGANVIALTSGYALDADQVSRTATVRKKVNLGAQSTFSVQASVSQAHGFTFHANQAFLAGFQTEVGSCEIFKLG
jgi:hypothetical protein